MNPGTSDLLLEAPPDAATILLLRQQAQDTGQSLIATFDDRHRQPLYLVVSNRGTCVLLDNHIAVRTYSREWEAEKVAEALGGEA